MPEPTTPSVVDPGELRLGLEAEYALVDEAGALRDFRTLTWTDAQRIVDRLGTDGHPDLVRGDVGIKVGRWYVEGDERFDDDGRCIDCVPKGLETRTPPVVGIDAAVAGLAAQTTALASAVAVDGYRLATIGWNPFATAYRPRPPYTAWERRMRAAAPVFTAPDVYMLSYGPDLNLSHPDWSDADAVDVARRLTWLSPALVPFAFSAPFARGTPSGALSVRTARRTGRRQAVRVFVDAAAVPARQPAPPLVHAARIPAERGRIEFKAFDAVTRPWQYPALFALVAGVAVAPTAALPAPGNGGPRSGGCVPDGAAHVRAAARGFDDAGTARAAGRALAAARRSLCDVGLAELLDPLDALLAARRTPAHDLLADHGRTGVVPLPSVAVG